MKGKGSRLDHQGCGVVSHPVDAVITAYEINLGDTIQLTRSLIKAHYFDTLSTECNHNPSKSDFSYRLLGIGSLDISPWQAFVLVLYFQPATSSHSLCFQSALSNRFQQATVNSKIISR
ncbi:hypothetical protein FOVSG1_009680 [Fusarium oxysporum f. sp. vasinfectum]